MTSEHTHNRNKYTNDSVNAILWDTYQQKKFDLEWHLCCGATELFSC